MSKENANEKFYILQVPSHIENFPNMKILDDYALFCEYFSSRLKKEFESGFKLG